MSGVKTPKKQESDDQGPVKSEAAELMKFYPRGMALLMYNGERLPSETCDLLFSLKYSTMSFSQWYSRRVDVWRSRGGLNARHMAQLKNMVTGPRKMLTMEFVNSLFYQSLLTQMKSCRVWQWPVGLLQAVRQANLKFDHRTARQSISTSSEESSIPRASSNGSCW